ncbi:MAG: hypothetical protein QM714_12460 [Nocardioides sp.]|uniref:hypothetical protein n=1 Tax=Nocardioides sp. TaxID=35761 RepID=UPI0039E5C500
MARAVMLVAAIVYGYLAGYRRARDETLREAGSRVARGPPGRGRRRTHNFFEGR